MSTCISTVGRWHQKYLWLTIVRSKASHQSNDSQPSIELQLSVFTKLSEDSLDIRSGGITSFTGRKSNLPDRIIFFYIIYKCGHTNVLSKRQVWMSIFHIINLKKKFMDTGVLDFFNKKNNLGLLFLLKVRSCVFISNFHHSPLSRDIKLYH